MSMEILTRKQQAETYRRDADDKAGGTTHGVRNAAGSGATENAKEADAANDAKSASTVTKSAEENGVVYEKSDGKAEGTLSSGDKATYEINRMSKEDRAALVEKMKAAEKEREQSLVNMVEKMMGQQAKAHKTANGQNGFSVSGTVSAEARRKAQEDISEDGYYGVKQTSQRLFDFASALAGDDPEKMKKMQDAMNKGIGQAARKLGNNLPSICKETQNAANQLFENYYKDKGVA